MENSQIIFNKEKATQSILYVANRLERRDLHKIFKILYFAERKHLQDWGMPILGDTYIAMDAGPVPSRVYDILKIVRGDSYMSDTEGLKKMFAIEDWMYVVPLQNADLNKLSKSDIDALDWSVNTYGALSYDEIKEKSHDIARRSTAKDFAISWESIAREAGLDSQDIEYITQTLESSRSLV
ncbi:MAG: DUF4065 domain-containing protein [Bacteroidales bacterium]|jgi:uncharacterized phage-associated protein|nr:DUF4065 domain-containing protein [Bacteroidales bacterium]